MIIDQVLNPPMAGAAADSKDYHCMPISVPKDFVITCGKIISIDGGKVTSFNGSSYFAVITDDALNYQIGNATDEGSISVSKKGVRYLITTGTDMVIGDLVLAANDGSVEKGGATDSATAIGKAAGATFGTTDKAGNTIKLTAVEFNFDMIKTISKVATPVVQSTRESTKPANTSNNVESAELEAKTDEDKPINNRPNNATNHNK